MHRTLLEEEISEENKQFVKEINSGWNQLGYIKNLTTEEMQILAGLDLGSNKDAEEDQIEMVEILAKKFEGDKDTAYDPNLVKQYKRQAWNYKKKNKVEEFDIQDGPEPEAPKPKTKHVYTLRAIYTEIRLGLARLNRLLQNVPQIAEKFVNALGPFGMAVLSRVFSIAGLSYGLSFAFDFGVVLYSTFRSGQSEAEEKMSFLERTLTRFKNAMLKGDRPHRMANDGIWFAINLTAFLITGGLSSFLNIGGLAFDVLHEFEKVWEVRRKYTNLETKIKNEIKDVKTELKTKINQLKVHQNDKKLQEEIPHLNDKLEKLKCIKQKVREKKRSEMIGKIRPVAGSILILAGMAMVFFPPTIIPGAIAIGAGVAILGGSILTGIGKRFGDWAWGKIKGCFKKPAEDNPGPPKPPDPGPDNDKEFKQTRSMLITRMNEGTPLPSPSNAMNYTATETSSLLGSPSTRQWTKTYTDKPFTNSPYATKFKSANQLEREPLLGEKDANLEYKSPPPSPSLRRSSEEASKQ